MNDWVGCIGDLAAGGDGLVTGLREQIGRVPSCPMYGPKYLRKRDVSWSKD